MINIAILHGANLNMLGMREKSIYGDFSLDELNQWLEQRYSQTSELTFFQSNHEGDLVDKIHALKKQADAIVINAAAFTHSSIAIRDALLAVAIPFIEVHISNVYKREDFRKQSYLSDIAVGVITGLGKFSYAAAIDYFIFSQKGGSHFV